MFGEFIVLFSNLMLTMPWQIVAIHAVAIAFVALGLSGLSVGLGAMLPNFRETDADDTTQVVDYVAGMTDRFAIATYERLYGVSPIPASELS